MKLLPRGTFLTVYLSKAPWKWLLLLLITIGLIFGNVFLYEELTKPVPLEAVLRGVEKSLNAQNYRYQATARRNLEGKETVISEIWGEKSPQGVHLKGSLPIIKAEVEIYQLGDKMYRKDPLTKGWLMVPNRGKASMEQLIAELNPLSVFSFQQDIAVQYRGKDKVGSVPCWVYEVMTKGENEYLELYWQDFNYRLWVDRKDGYLRKAEISAEHRDNSLHVLTVSITFSDYNEPIEIKAPVDTP